MTEPPSLIARYEALVASGALERDPAQLVALERLDRLARALCHPLPRALWPFRALSFLRGLSSIRARSPSRARETPRGLYLYGLVGRGKTTLMDLFFAALPLDAKRRVHFHAFMGEIHARLSGARGAGAADPLTRVALEIARETRVLCFDEFAVTDIADATLLSRLFSTLVEQGVVVVATSNVEPSRLYEGGRNRDLFLPFIALLETRFDILRLDARADFRLEKNALDHIYFTPADDRARAALDALFERLTGGARGAPRRLRVAGRDVDIPRAAERVARFAFADICGRPLGPADYHAFAEAFDAILIDDVPAMSFDRRNEAKRFITLVDVLYEKKTLLIISAEAEAPRLYAAPTGHEAREFARTASRLIEMRSRDYLAERDPGA